MIVKRSALSSRFIVRNGRFQDSPGNNFRQNSHNRLIYKENFLPNEIGYLAVKKVDGKIRVFANIDLKEKPAHVSMILNAKLAFPVLRRDTKPYGTGPQGYEQARIREVPSLFDIPPRVKIVFARPIKKYGKR